MCGSGNCILFLCNVPKGEYLSTVGTASLLVTCLFSQLPSDLFLLEPTLGISITVPRHPRNLTYATTWAKEPTLWEWTPADLYNRALGYQSWLFVRVHSVLWDGGHLAHWILFFTGKEGKMGLIYLDWFPYHLPFWVSPHVSHGCGQVALWIPGWRLPECVKGHASFWY